MKIHTEEMKKEGFDNLSLNEVKDMIGFVEPSDDGNTWDVTTSDGGVFVCKSQENAYIMASLEELKAKLFA